MGLLAPVILFVYNRPDHVHRTVAALKNNILASESELIVFSDGAATPDAEPRVREVRTFVRGISGFRKVTVVEREQNLGLAANIIDGVTQIVNACGRVIVLEDDLVTSPYFLKYMNDALDLYEKEERVVSIHGYTLPVGSFPETFFIKGADCWGWATWKRGWDVFEPDGLRLLNELERRGLTRAFDFDGTCAYTQMLRDQIAGKNDSWAIRWQAATYLAETLTLNPGVSLVQNTGFDGSGVHCGVTDSPGIVLAERPIYVSAIALEECGDARKALAAYYRERRSLWIRVKRRISCLARELVL